MNETEINFLKIKFPFYSTGDTVNNKIKRYFSALPPKPETRTIKLSQIIGVLALVTFLLSLPTFSVFLRNVSFIMALGWSVVWLIETLGYFVAIEIK